ncbi:MAG: YkvA family protein [Gammaproteobacteria bacterium]
MTPDKALVPLSATGAFAGAYSSERFRDKLRRHAARLGRDLVELALLLFYALQAPTTPPWARGVMLGALGYLISLVDFVPDLTPVVGYTDDLAVLSAAAAAVARSITPAIRARAAQQVARWFGDRAPGG